MIELVNFQVSNHILLSVDTCFDRHSMGVCSVQNYSDVEHFISTGSYDETLYIWDLRMIHSSKDFVSIPLHSCHFGGGVWRHKWGPHNCVIVSAMHGGFAVAHLPQSSFSCQDKAVKDSVYKFRRTNGQLAYGIDWGLFHGINEKEDFFKSTVVSCSFYDNTIEFGELSVHI
ncbi:Diphthine methyltransferase [Schistosoma japonicum]|nr:Diphthine methyltransferase [Schistosoma japonicum]